MRRKYDIHILSLFALSPEIRLKFHNKSCVSMEAFLRLLMWGAHILDFIDFLDYYYFNIIGISIRNEVMSVSIV